MINVIAFLDREQGARENLDNKGLPLTAVLTASRLLAILEANNKITQEQAAAAREFFLTTKPDISAAAPVSAPPVSTRTFSDRQHIAGSQMAKTLFTLMESKKTNLCVASDFTSVASVLALADLVGPYICVFKTHVDIISDFAYAEFVVPLQSLAAKHNFLIFEDRKFADIGNTVRSQYGGGVYKISSWADLSNSHLVAGASSISSLQDVAKASSAPRGLLLIAQMSTKDTTASGTSLASLALAVAESHSTFVCGFICQGRLRTPALPADDGFVYLTPGVQLETGADSQGQQYRTPENAVAAGSDVIIVGRGITEAIDPRGAAEEYRARAWDAYSRRCQK